MTRRPRPRRQFMFWLYRDIVEQESLIQYVDYLRRTRQFATVIRNGLRLMWTLSDGNMSVLFELFPTLKSQFKPDNSSLIEEFEAMLNRRVDALEKFMESSRVVVQAPATTGKSLSSVQLSAPVYADEDQDTVIIRHDETAAKQSSNSFLDAVFGLQDVEVDLGTDAQHE